mgnify:CR=1 FL=1
MVVCYKINCVMVVIRVDDDDDHRYHLAEFIGEFNVVVVVVMVFSLSLSLIFLAS